MMLGNRKSPKRSPNETFYYLLLLNCSGTRSDEKSPHKISANVHGRNSFKIKAPKLGTCECWLCWSAGTVRWEEKRSLAASTYVKQQGSSSVSD